MGAVFSEADAKPKENADQVKESRCASDLAIPADSSNSTIDAAEQEGLNRTLSTASSSSTILTGSWARRDGSVPRTPTMTPAGSPEASQKVPSPSGSGSGLVKGSKFQKPAEWSSRQLERQIFTVVRHAERADALGALHRGRPWTLSEEFGMYPVDPPLSDLGKNQAVHAGRQVKAQADRSGSRIHVVVSSPYLRCFQTALQVCLQLGSDTKLMVDYSLGEVFGPCVFGDRVPAAYLRPFHRLAAMARNLGVRCVNKPCGKPPLWPETLKRARQRYAVSFLHYLHRSEKSRRNFALISHADCVASVLALLPCKAGHLIESVAYAATVFASRPMPAAPKRHQKSPDPVAQIPQTQDGEEKDADTSFTSIGSNSSEQELRDRSNSPKRRSCWEVSTSRLTVGPQWRDAKASSRAVKVALRMHSQKDEALIEELLGGLSTEPLGDVTPSPATRGGSAFDDTESPTLARNQEDNASSCSSSTLVFGQSDFSVESCLSPRSMVSEHTFSEIDRERRACRDECLTFGRAKSDGGRFGTTSKDTQQREALREVERLGVFFTRDDREDSSEGLSTNSTPTNSFFPVLSVASESALEEINSGSPSSPMRLAGAEGMQLRGCGRSAIMARRAGNGTPTATSLKL